MTSGNIYKYGTMTRFYDGMPDPTAGEGSPFVIAGVLHRTITLLYGMTMAGKSTLATAWAMAVSGQAQTWLGKRVTRHGHVLIVTGDPNGRAEYNERLWKAGGRNIDVYAPNRPAIPATWSEVSMAVRTESTAMVVLDNLSAFVPGTLNDDFGYAV